MLHTIQAIGPDLLLILSWAIGAIGVVCCLIALHGVIARGWSAERLLGWIYPVTLSQLMDRFGWWPLLATVAVLAGAWLWSVREQRLEARSATA